MSQELSFNRSRLSNLGNTCYQNAVLHPLIHTPNGFIEFIMSGVYLKNFNSKSESEIYDSLTFQLHRILNAIFKSNDTELNINTWKRIVGQKNAFFDGYNQNDAQEFLSFIIEKITEEIGNQVKFIPTRKVDISYLSLSQKILNIQADNYWNCFHRKKYSLMVPMFSGLFRTKLTYLDSGAISSNFAPFTIIPLNLPDNKIDTLTLNDCFDELINEEELDKDNMVSGKLSYGKYLGKKQETIWKLPKYMTVQLKRFKYNDFGQISMKDTRKVSYPLEIDMSKYIDEASKYKKLSNKYKLYGVTLHHGMMMGSFSSGHYIALVQNRTNNKWYLYNDDKKPCELDEKMIINNNAYILYYVRKD